MNTQLNHLLSYIVFPMFAALGTNLYAQQPQYSVEPIALLVKKAGSIQTWDGKKWVPDKSTTYTGILNLNVTLGNSKFSVSYNVRGNREEKNTTFFKCTSNWEEFYEVSDLGYLPIIRDLQEVNDANIIQMLENLKSPDENTKAKAAWALWKFQTHSQIQSLLNSLKTGSTEKKVKAVQVLAGLHHPEVEPALQTATQDEDQQIRDIAQNALTNRKNR